MRRWIPAMVVIVAAALAGCGNNEEKRFRLSGEARFDGKPIPHGDVVFTPDGAKKNTGPQGIAQIRNGKYDTAAADGKGIAGGPTVLKVTGLSGPGGKLICEFELRVDLPRADGTHNIDVPRQGAAKAPAKSGDI